MKRRDFISTGTIAGLTTLVAASCQPKPAAPTEPATTSDAIGAFELNEESISSLQEKMTAGKYSALQITQLYLNRIDAIDKKGPWLNAVIEVNPDALNVAKAMDD
ncbi:MAG: amidase, partial [Chitinophagaceae bacterium]|nr:amidase [Chitinophagaceae bacterium]